MNHSFRIFGFALLASLTALSVSHAQVKLPKPPDSYDVEFRYRIKADRNERIKQFEEMTKVLNDLGFKETQTEESDQAMFDPSVERMIGTMPSSTARQLLNESHIQTVLLTPAGYKPPQDEKESVKILLELNTGFTLERQRLFASQVKDLLSRFGFVEAISYDHRGYVWLRGTMPWVRVRPLLKDLRGQPSGWFLPLTSEDDLPEPFRTKLPIRLIEVFSEQGAPAPIQGQAPLPPIPPDQPYLARMSADLRRHLLEEGKSALPLRLEVSLDYTPDDVDNAWRDRLRQANPSTAIEGRIGNVVTLTVSAGEQATLIARSPIVLHVRLPRTADVIVPASTLPDPKKEEPKEKVSTGNLFSVQSIDKLDVLKETRLDRLHAANRRGAGIRVAVIDTDFTGYEKYVGRELPKSTLYLDMTAERNSDILPEPAATPPGGMGHGTHCALAVRYAAPAADIVLIRVAPDAPYQLVTAYRFMKGDFTQPESFRMRREELEIDTGTLRSERLKVNADYRKAFDNFDDDEKAREARRVARAALADVAQREKILTARAERLINLELTLARIKGTTVVLNTVGWNSGQPLDATSNLSRFLDGKMSVARPNVVRNGAKLPRPTVWFQPAGDTRGQGWIGQFHDPDGNGIMDFGVSGTSFKPDRWTSELNFLSFRKEAHSDVADLPANARLRISLQWREPHDPEISEIEYREPIAPLNLMLLHQRDPQGEKVPSDEMEIVARSEGAAERLHYERNFGIYEQTIDVTLPLLGRYALRVDGRQPQSIRPGGALGVRDQEVRWELKPRIFVEVLDGTTRAKGRVVFGDYESQLGGVAVPADARTVVAVGAMHASKRPEPFSAIGAGPQSELLIKPDVMIYDQLPTLGDGNGTAKGTALSASLATGMGASLLGAGATPGNFLHWLGIMPGHIFEIPEGWIRK